MSIVAQVRYERLVASCFTYHQPSPELIGLVAFHYVLDTGDGGFDEALCALLGQVQIGLNGAAIYHFVTGDVTAPPVCLIAPTDSAIRMSAPPGFRAVGSALTPAGWDFLADHAKTPRNAVIALDHPNDLLDLGKAVDPSALDRWLRRAFAGRAIDPRIGVIDAWAVSNDGADVEALALALGLSRRSLERLTLRTHGTTPKRLSAKYRALKAAATLATGKNEDWRRLSAAEHFADQAHFIREFRRYVGVTPGVFLANDDNFARRLIRGRWSPEKQLGIAIYA